MTLSRPLRINWLIVGIDAFQHVAEAGILRPRPLKNALLSRRPTRIPAEKERHHTHEGPSVKRCVTSWRNLRFRALLARMPTKTPARKASKSKKPAARKAASKRHNGATSKHQASAKHPAPARHAPKRKPNAAQLLAETTRLHAQVEESAARTTALEKELADARAFGSVTHELEQQLTESQARLAAQRSELETARSEMAGLRDDLVKARSMPPPPRPGCPKCGGHMSDFPVEAVRARRCDACSGIFFETGELERMIRHHDDKAKAGEKGWFWGMFGKK
jgi:hypothetical protein